MKKSSLVMILALVGMVGCAYGQTQKASEKPATQTSTWYHPPCKKGDQRGVGITGKDAPAWQDEKTGMWCIHIHEPAVKKLQTMVPGIHQHPPTGCRQEKLGNGEDCLFCPGDDGPVCSYQAARPVAPPTPNAPVLSFDPITFATTSTFPPIHAQATESTDDKGYHYVIDSPDKSFKCYVVSTLEENPRNTYDHDIAAFTVACVKSVEKAK